MGEPSEALESRSKPNFCAKCGAERPSGAGFCPTCGTAFDPAPAVPPPTDRAQVPLRENRPVWRPATVLLTLILIVAAIAGGLYVLNSTVAGASLKCSLFGDVVACVESRQSSPIENILSKIGHDV